MQCVGEGATYVGGAIGALQIMKVRASRSRAAAAIRRSPAPPEPAQASTDSVLDRSS